MASQTVASPTAQLPQVTLASGWTAPTWQAADFDITAVADKANTYTATLSAQGIAALQAANPNAKITAQNVQAGTLTVHGTTAQKTAAKSTTTTTDQQPADSQASAKPAAAQTSTTASGSAATVDSSTSDQSITATDSDQQSDATQSTTSAPAVTALGGAATQTDIDKAKTAAESAMKKTGQAQVITAMSGEPQDTAPSTSTASITSSTDKIGYGSGVTGSFTLTINMTVKAGDVVTFTLPTPPTKQFVNGVFSLKSIQDFGSPDQGTVEKVTNPDGSITVTDTIKSGTNYSQTVTLSLYDNYAGQDLLTVGDTPYTVNVAVNGKQTGSTTFTMTVDPQVFLGTPTQTHPNTTVAGLLPNTDYVWEVPVNEGDGVLDQWYQSARVNSAVNYGTTITIPTPAGFVLNQDLTNQVNSFDPGSSYNIGTIDTTTIKQVGGAGGDIIITVPKGSGSQYYDKEPAYRLAGHFETTQAATDTTLTAAGPVTMVQKNR
ncbi:MBG domain-containing protein [Lacticaseibacillus nasuensis]|uniref:MBG domain-containing protein n=1 Tax=Lacticaseibacillus nasuensis TaxID=944671 RepID=UPI001CDB2194|nr:MBG domain-containing protein [Lacticaseibacillus nasuensis]